jgi:hypothetical protein
MISLYLPKALALKPLGSYKIFEFLLIITINKSMGLRGILNFHLLRDAFLYRLAREIPLKKSDSYPLQSKIRTPTPHLR